VSELKIEAGQRPMTTYLRIEPQPRNPETFGISPVWGQGVPRSVGKYCVHAAFDEGGKRVDRWLPCPHQPGTLLDGKRVVSVGVVQREDGWFWEVTTDETDQTKLRSWAIRNGKGRIRIRSNGDLIYDGPEVDMPPDVAAIAAEMVHDWPQVTTEDVK
jgi:hypothetical protein